MATIVAHKKKAASNPFVEVVMKGFQRHNSYRQQIPVQ